MNALARGLWRAVSDWRWLAAFAVLFSPLLAPEVLAFPYVARSNGDTVYSVAPIDQAALDRVTKRGNDLVAASPLARPSEPRPIFLTDGGWRWRWLALNSASALAFTRPGREAIIVQHGNVATDEVPTAFGKRTLSSIIAHEKCHGLERRRFGISVDWTRPMWLREGYCDVVGAESTLSDAQAEELVANHKAPPALTYYRGRRRVEAILASNHGNVDALFGSAR